MAQGAQQGTHQRGLTDTQPALEPDHHAGKQQGRQLATQVGGGRFVGKLQSERTLGMIRAMQGLDSTRREDGEQANESCAYADLVIRIKEWGRALGFSAIGIAHADVSAASHHLLRWLALGRHGEMDYMAKHAPLRCAPQSLLPGALTVISARLPYWPVAADARQVLADGTLAYVSRYALGRDYHKTMRRRLQQLADELRLELVARGLGERFACRAFCDSAPVLETEFARLAGVGWRGKHTLSLTRMGSWHFLGEIYTNLPLPADAPIAHHCGSYRRCLDACPTAAIISPYEVDARRCISYLTIELAGPIPHALRPLIGNRIYGCDDCQICCPWNRFGQFGEADFAPRHGLDAPQLAALFAWSEEEFAARMAGSAIRRIGYQRWLRNIAVALGNAPGTPEVVAALEQRRDSATPLVREHIDWALAQHLAQGKWPRPPTA